MSGDERVPMDAAAFCVTGAALSACQARFAWQTWQIQYLHRCPRKLGDEPVPMDAAAFCVTGVTPSACQARFAWQAWHVQYLRRCDIADSEHVVAGNFTISSQASCAPILGLSAATFAEPRVVNQGFKLWLLCRVLATAIQAAALVERLTDQGQNSQHQNNASECSVHMKQETAEARLWQKSRGSLHVCTKI